MTFDHEDTTFASSTETNALSVNETFTESDGLQFALGIIYPTNLTYKGIYAHDILQFAIYDDRTGYFELRDCTDEDM